MKKIISLVVAMMALSVASAHADSTGTGAKDFEARIVAYHKSCASKCQIPFVEHSAFELKNSNSSKLAPETRARLEQIANEQAQVWGDTILEGDYHSNGKTQLDQVFAIYEDQTFVGYKITYSEQAWYVGECEFAYKDLTTLNECKEGRIRESSFVSADFTTYFRDENDYADFN